MTTLDFRRTVARVDWWAVRRAALTWLLMAVAAVLYAVAWLAGAVVQACAWARAALVVGWRDGRESIRKGWSA